ncbi:GIY-YIG nuclease family protein, partial [Pseudoxanthomonas sp.]|uniref:GIY-YIG nuclease family protein n=2 Tax=Pseudoxanthomonas TaxID=83618 RepID=UPI0031B58A70
SRRKPGPSDFRLKVKRARAQDRVGTKQGKECPMRQRNPCVYILASQRNGTLYIGVTSDLASRVWQHKNDQVSGFTRRYRVHTLVWYESHDTMPSAIAREKALKEWKREWKLRLIEDTNPYWLDLYGGIA